MKKVTLITLSLIALPLCTMAQMIPLSSAESKNQLWIDPGRVYDYNLYEKSRWGIGLQYDINFKTEKELVTMENPKGFKALSLSGYIAYGYADQRFKWGLKADLQGVSKKQSHTYLSFFHDLTPDASRTLTVPTINILTLPASFMTSSFSDTYRFTLGYTRKASKSSTENFELCLSRERPLHYGSTLFYPQSYSELNNILHFDFIESQFYIAYTSGWSAQLLAGGMQYNHTMGPKSTPSNFGSKKWTPFARLLVQYDRHFYLSFLDLGIFAQAGAVTPKVPTSRMFDLGGSWGSPLLLNHSLLTARPNEFTANIFGMINLKLTTVDPLFKFYNRLFDIGTSPQPFLLANAAWGKGSEAPDQGIAEAGAGIDGLLVWGLVYWGFGMVYRFTPESAYYHLPDPKDNYTFLFTAHIDL